jgi:Piwi domain
MNRQLALNLSPIKFEDVEINVGIFNYQSKEQLKNLRCEYNTHVFHRDNQNQILSVSIIPEGMTLGEKSKTIKLSDDLHLCAVLIRNSLINFLHKNNRKVIKYNPIEFIAKENLLAKILPNNDALTWLSVNPVYSAAVRTVSFDHRSLSLGMALNVRTVRRIEQRCDALLAEGFPLIDLYVSRLIPANDRRMAPYSRLLGRVQSIEDGQLTLADARSEEIVVSSGEVFLEPRSEAFNRCLKHMLKEEASQVKQTLDRDLAEFRKGPTRLDMLQKVIEYFITHPLEILPGSTFILEPFLTEVSSRTFPAVHTAPKPTYVFDPTGNKTDTWHDRGLNKYGPYTAQTFTPSKPHICVICQKTQKGLVEQFLYKLLNGITLPSSDRQPFVKGFIREYSLEGVSTQFFMADSATAEGYQRAIREALSYQREHDLKWDLALIQINESFHDLYGDDNPYLIAKAAFLTQQISVQEFEAETIDVPDKKLVYILNNMALATYAKLGGIPWLIKANPTITHELVFGLGSASIGEGRLGRRERVVGITTVFTGDGNYKLSTLSQAVPFVDYKNALLRSLRDTINKVQRTMNWEPRDHVRLIFHAFKPMKDAEVEAVRALMSELGDYDVEYAFIHIADDHPYILFDKSQNGVSDYETRTQKGIFAPQRGGFLRLSGAEVLLSLTGAREVKRPQDGIPCPILLHLHRSSSFRDMTYLTRQVFTFSCHSWRSFFPAPMPVNIRYSQLIAKMLGQLGTVSRWDPDVMLGRIGETRWFL